jgi:hypothetical protein
MRHHRQGLCGCLFRRFDVPAHLTSDRGVQFTSALWQDLCQSLGMAHHQTSAYHLQANGLVEQFHRQLKDTLRARLCGLDWAEHLPWVLLGLRAAPKEDPAVSSAELVLGSQLVLPGQFLDAPDWPLQDLGRVRQQMTAASGGLPTRPLRGEQLDSYCPPQLFKAELLYIKVGDSKPPLQPLYGGGRHRQPPSVGHDGPAETTPGSRPCGPGRTAEARAATGLEDESSTVQPASCKRGSRLRGACVADGGKILQVNCM